MRSLLWCLFLAFMETFPAVAQELNKEWGDWKEFGDMGGRYLSEPYHTI
ncbi:hypothetical protein [Bacteroides sp. GM023]|nr:hypothetical protein [Bacteroides sp. GM023]